MFIQENAIESVVWKNGGHFVTALMRSDLTRCPRDSLGNCHEYLLWTLMMHTCMYRKVSNIRRTQNQNLNNYRLNMQLPLPNPLKPGVKSRMKM